MESKLIVRLTAVSRSNMPGRFPLIERPGPIRIFGAADVYLPRGKFQCHGGFAPFHASQRFLARRDAYSVNIAQSVDAESRSLQYGGGVSVGDGDWFDYRDVNFGAGATQLGMTVDQWTNPVSGTVSLHLDGIDGPMIGSMPIATAQDISYTTGAVAGAAGVHDVYFVFNFDLGSNDRTIGFQRFQFARNAPPLTPINFTISTTPTTAQLTATAFSWDSNSTDVSSFVVERSTDGVHFTTVIVTRNGDNRRQPLCPCRHALLLSRAR